MSEPKASIPVIGIDLGTTFTVAGYYDKKRVRMIPNDESINLL